MGIYTESSVQYNGVQRESIEDMINDDRVVPSSSDDFVSEGMEVILGMTENYNMVMEHIGRSELLALEQTGEQLVYTEGVIGSIFSTIKKFLSKVWEKIKSLFKRFIMMIDSYTKNDKAFINKYRQQIYRHKSLSDFTFKGYIYTIDTGKIKDMMDVLREESKKAKDDAINNPSNQGQNTAEYLQKEKIDKMDDIIEEIRGKVLAEYPKGKDSKYTSEEFRKEFKELLRNGESEKQELDGSNSSEIDVDGMVTELQNYRETKKAVDTAYKESKKAIDEDNKEVDRLSKEHSKSDDYKNNKMVEDGSKDIFKKVYTLDYNNREKDNDSDTGTWQAQYVNGGKFTDESFIRHLAGYPREDIKKFFDMINNTNESKSLYYGPISRGDWSSYEAMLYAKVEIKNGKKIIYVSAKEKHKRQGKYIQIAFKVINQTKQCLVDIDTIVLQALKERSRQYKACLVKIVYHNPKNEEAYNESYSYNNQFQQNFTSPLSNIEFK